MGITGTEIAIPTMTVKVAALSGEETASVAPTWSAEATDSRWEPVRIRMGCNGELSTLTLRRILGAKGEQAYEEPEDAGTLHGNRVRIIDGDSAEWFAGYTGQDSMLIQADPQAEDVQVTVYGPELRLAQKVVSGQWHINEDVEDKIFAGTSANSDFTRANTHASDIPAVFNADNKPNMYDSTYTWTLATAGSDADRGCSVFDAPDRKVMEYGQSTHTIEAEFWTAKSALRSLVEYVDDGNTLNISAAEWDAIETALGTARIGQVDVEGMTLLEAIRAVLLPIGFGFSVDVVSQDGAGSYLHRLRVEDLRKAGTTVELVLGQKGFGVSSTYGASEIKRLDFMRDGHNIRNEVTVIGGQIHRQVQLDFDVDASPRDLYPAWDTADHDLGDYDTNNVIDMLVSGMGWGAFAEKYHLKGADHALYLHVFRSFAWNEDGAFSAVIYDGSSNSLPVIPDLPGQYGIGDGYNCLRRPRPVGPAHVWTDNNKTTYQPARVVMWQVVGSVTCEVDITRYCDIWQDRAGFTILGGSRTKDLFDVADDGMTGNPWCPFEECPDAPTALRETSYLTLLHNAIRGAGTYKLGLSLHGSVEDDTAVKATSPKQAGRAMPLLSKRVVRMPRFRKLVTSDDMAGTEDTRDDTALCSAQAALLRNTGEDELGMGSIMLPFVARTLAGETLRPLLGVTGTTGRVIDFDVDGGADINYPLIRSVIVTFGNAQVTELTLDSNLLGIS